MDHNQNAKQLFNVLLPLKLMQLHETSLFNMKVHKYVLFDNSNDWALCKKTHKLTLLDGVLNCWMLTFFSNKLVLPVSSKIS